MKLRALFLGAPGVVSSGIARGWQLAGHSIAGFWYPERLRDTPDFVQDEALAARAPGVSMHGLAERAGVPVRAVPRLSTWAEANTEAAAVGADVVISALFLDLIPRTLLAAFPGRVVNLHPSLLPAYRGRWPTFNMLWDRTIDRFGGMTLHVVSDAFDQGGIIAQVAVRYPEDRNLSAYYMHLVKAGSALLTDVFPRYLAGDINPEPQPKAQAPQSNRRPSQALLTADQSADDMAWLCATIPQMTPLQVAGAAEDIAIKAFIRSTGAPAGTPPILADDGVLELDARDARVQLAIGR